MAVSSINKSPASKRATPPAPTPAPAPAPAPTPTTASGRTPVPPPSSSATPSTTTTKTSLVTKGSVPAPFTALSLMSAGSTDGSGASKAAAPTAAPATVSDEDKATINNVYGQLIGKMNNLSSVNRSQVAILDGKDFSEIEASNSEAAFVPHVRTFLQNIIDDGKRFEAAGKDGDTYIKEIKDLNANLNTLRDQKGYTDAQISAAMDPLTSGLMKSATEELANSTATLVDTGKTYGDRLDGKAQELLTAWDQTKHNEHTQEIADTITTVFSLFGTIGVGGNAMVQLALKDAAKATEGAAEAWAAFGQRGAQISNLFWAVTATDMRAYTNSSPHEEAVQMDGKADASLQHLQALRDRFQQYVDDYNNEPPSDGGWYIPTL